MVKAHNRSITSADEAAAARLKSLWLGIPKDERPTQQALADLWDGGGEANQSLISQYMNGKIALNYRAVLFFAKALGVEPLSIRSDLPELRSLQTIDDDSVDILGYAQAAGLGDGVEASEYAETHKLKFRSASLARKRLAPNKLAVIYGKGDSMLPRIHSGDAILFDTSDTTPFDEKLYVILTAGIAGNEYSVKRCRSFGDDIYFDALNPSGDHNWKKPRKMDDRRHPISIIGRVRWIGSWED